MSGPVYGYGSLYLVRPDGSELRRLGQAAGGPAASTWSPYARSISFLRSKGGGPLSALTILEVASGAERAIGSGSGVLAWAPDGSFGVFDGACGAAYADLCRWDAVSGQVTRVTDFTAGGRPVFAPK